jgi:tetratricopeptide (TPR) repeat protein
VDTTTFNRAKQAYASHDWETAVMLFSQCGTGVGTGEACHLCGNALMRLGRVQEATQAYRAAAADPSYRNQGAVYTNLGKAQMTLGDLRGAVDSLRHALSDGSYQGAYKAYTALGEAYSKLGDARNAGVAYRKAALEDNNPDPAKSLINLGVCFMQLRRPADAAEAYRTAIDFSTSEEERLLLSANLGQAYVASNRMLDAVSAFETAVAGGYRLSPAASADYERALAATSRTAGAGGSYAGGYTGGDPLDPTGASGELLPPPDASGFFSIPESELEGSSGRRHGRKIGLKLLIVVLALLVLAAAGLFVAYQRGFGFPSQEAAVTAVFEAAEAGTDASGSWASTVSAAARSQAMSEIESGDVVAIEGMDVSVDASVAVVSATLPQGGVLTYRVSLVREGLGWKVSNVERVFSSVTSSTYTDALASADASAEPAAEAATADETLPDEAAAAAEDQGEQAVEGGEQQAA